MTTLGTLFLTMHNSIYNWQISIVRNNVPKVAFLAAVIIISVTGVLSAKNKSDKKSFRIPVTWINDGRDSHGGGDYGRKLKIDGHDRFYEIHVPQKYDSSHSYPLVLVFHGGGGDPGTIRYESGMDTVSDREGFIVVYPAGTNRRLLLKNRLLLWNDGRPYDNGTYSKIDDVNFVAALLGDMGALFNIDDKRTYACGFSNGAQFTYKLAKRLSGRISAIAVVAGQRYAGDSFDPHPSRPMPVMQFSGLQDQIAPYNGGDGPAAAGIKAVSPPVKETIKSWVEFNKCPPAPAEVIRKGKAVMERYGPGADNSEVILWTLEDGGHTWPGGKIVPNVELLGLGKMGATNHDINASGLMWEFFKKFQSE